MSNRDDAAGLLRAILAQPDDDLLRLHYADVMEMLGESERAAFIRCQIELARMEVRRTSPQPLPTFGISFHKELDALRCRERELLERRYGDPNGWYPSIPNRAWRLDSDPLCRDDPAFLGMTFTRGFVSAVTLSWADWHTHAAAIRAATALSTVALTTLPTLGRYTDGLYRIEGIDRSWTEADMRAYGRLNDGPQDLWLPRRLLEDVYRGIRFKLNLADGNEGVVNQSRQRTDDIIGAGPR
jgi:uncharacterized protein (TIGR02996 family)